jgi:hypothetical protein
MAVDAYCAFRDWSIVLRPAASAARDVGLGLRPKTRLSFN